MKRQRRQYSADWKAKVALEAVKGQRTIDAFGVRAEVPGFNSDEIQVSLESHRLTIMGQRQRSRSQQKGKNVYTDRCSDQIFRAIDLPADVASSKATATLKDGILDLVLPKAAPVRKIPVAQKSA